MADQDYGIKIDKWPGLATNRSPHLAPSFAVEQMNMQCLTPGVLSVRKGLKIFNAPTGTNEILSMYRMPLHSGLERTIIHRTALTGYEASPTAAVGDVARTGEGADLTAIRASQSGFQPMSFCMDRRGNLYGFNGIDRGFRFDGLQDTADDCGLDPPAAAPTIATPALGSAGATAGDYYCAYQFIDDETPDAIQSSLSTATTVTAVANDEFEWSALSQPTQTRAIGVRLWRSTMGQSKAVYLVAEMGVNGSYASVADSGGFCQFTWAGSPRHRLIVGSVIDVTVVTGGAVGGAQTVTAITETTFTTTKAWPGSGGTGTWLLTGFTKDEYSDTALALRTTFSINDGGGRPNMRRFVPPPTFKPYAVMFQDRLWMAGRVVYDEGLVSIDTAGAVTGTRTRFTSAMVGRYLVRGTQRYLIASVASGTSLQLTGWPVSSTSSNTTYTIIPEPQERNTLYYSEIDEPESMLSTNNCIVQENTGDDDEVTGLMPAGTALYVLKDRHVYKLTYFNQPILNISIVPVTARGCVNHRCWVKIEDSAYLMDQIGIYKFSGGSAESISDPIQDIFRDGTIDWSKKKYFHAVAVPQLHCIRFFVCYTTDTATNAVSRLPRRWLEYNIRTQTWSTGRSPIGLGHSCFTLAAASYMNQVRVLAGGEDDHVYMMDEGYSDRLTTALRGTVTSATSNTISDSTAAFTDAVLNTWVAIIDGTGRNQYYRVGARTGTQLTLLTESAAPTWAVTPVAGSKYIVGAVPFNMKTGLMRFVANTPNEIQRQMRLTYEPTNGDQILDLRRYLDHNPTAENYTHAFEPGAGVVCTADDPSTVVDMDRTTSDLGVSWVGYETLPIPGRVHPDSAGGPRTMRAEIAGFAADKAISLYCLEVIGVAE